ncbi:hypothetical protein BGZ46_004510 [Entomortierella lignicola]|nr:hypothetical protein BGZ46_004510 [Entomortierella lignicola]
MEIDKGDLTMSEDFMEISNRIDPIVIPEILTNILGFLDPASLRVCTRVSHQWRLISQSISWRICSIDESYFFDNLERHIDSGEDGYVKGDIVNRKRLTGEDQPELSLICSKIRSLSISEAVDSQFLHSQYYDCNPRLSTQGMEFLFNHGLMNLVHLKVQLAFIVLLQPDNQKLFLDAVKSVLSRNPQIRDLELGIMTGSTHSLLELLQATRNQPRRLSIIGHFTQEIDITRIFRFFMDPENPSAKNNDVALDELLIYNRCVDEHGSISQLPVSDFALTPGLLPIHSLSLIGFETGSTFSYEELMAGIDTIDPSAPSTSNVLAILRICPLLKRLCVRPDLSFMTKPSGKEFRARLIEAFPLKTFEEIWIPESDDFVRGILEACPKLKAIDFGMMYELNPRQWYEITTIFGPQLESLRVFDVQSFESPALLNLVGPPLCHPLRISAPTLYCLTDLDISGISHLNDAAWLLFAHIPTMKRLAARDVPLYASDLIGYDWACKDIESLEIFVLIPKQWRPKTVEWVWDDLSREWTRISQTSNWEYRASAILYQGRQEPSTGGRRGETEGENQSEDGYEEKYRKKRRRHDDGTGNEEKKSKGRKKKSHKNREDIDEKRPKEKKDRKDKKRKEHKEKDKNENKEKKRKNKKEHKGTEVDSQKQSKTGRRNKVFSDSDLETHSDTSMESSVSLNPQTMRPKDYSKYVQIQVCEQLGRLRKLRSLTLEGKNDYYFNNCEWGCLELTIDTGLDRLEPLQNSLERLVIYQLREKLCGAKELDWIARHWVHHQNSHWLQTYQPFIEGYNQTSVSNNSSHSQDHVSPCPVFKELIGISIRGMDRSVLKTNLALAWFQEECPTVTVEKDAWQDYDDFSYGRFQEY